MPIVTSRHLFVLCLVGLLTTGCGTADSLRLGYESASEVGDDAAADTDADTDAATATDTDADVDTGEPTTDADSDTFDTDDPATDADTDELCWAGVEEEGTVDGPEPGVPATPQALCSADQDPAISNTAAPIVLAPGGSWNQAAGTLTIPGPLANRLTSPPRVRVAWADHEFLLDATISEVAPVNDEGGFGFTISWNPDSFGLGEALDAVLALAVTLELTCQNGQARQVEAETWFARCDGPNEQGVWRASGEQCVVCEDVQEVAASPVQTTGNGADLALNASQTVRLVPGAVDGLALAVAVEGAARTARCTWRTRHGSVAGSGRQAVWTLPATPGPFQLQVVVEDDNGAAVTSLTWRPVV